MTTEPKNSGRPPLWRRRWIVDAPFQWHMILRALTQTTLTLLLVSLGIFGPIIGRLRAADASAVDDPAIVMLYMHSRFWWIAAACFAIAAVGALLLSHRIAGPLVRFKRNLRWLAEGRLPAPLRTRDGDHLKIEVDCLNAAVAGIAQRVEAVRTAHADLAAGLQRCAAEFATGSEQVARQALAVALERAATVTRELAAFQTTPDLDRFTPAQAKVPHSTGEAMA